MADSLVSVVLRQLASIIQTEVQQEVTLVVGTKREVEKLTATLTGIRAVLNDAERKQIKDNSVKVWLEELKDITYDLDNVLDEWNTRILGSKIEESSLPKRKMVRSYLLSPFSCFNQTVVSHDIGVKLKNIKERLDLIASEKDKYNFNLGGNAEEPERRETTSLIDASKICGRDLDKGCIINKLLCENSAEERGVLVISIVGMGGIGKTTLAQLAYNDDNVNAHFDKRIWVCVSEPFDEIRIAKTILKAVGVDVLDFFNWPNFQELLRSSIEGKKLLLVLDDVWTDDYKKWEPLKLPLISSAPGSRILVTTRNERVSKMMEATYTLPLGKLFVEDSWSLFSKLAFSGRSIEESDKLEEIGRKIADKCKGLPLAVKTLGGLMRFKETRQDWQNVLDSETWELEEVERGIFPPLLLSYYDLSSPMKRCFSYCAIFPKDYEIEKDILIKLWMAQGFLGSVGSTEMELKGAEYFDNLAVRSFFQDLERDKDDGSIISCKMHDIVHDFAQFLTMNECFILEVDSRKELRMDSFPSKARHSTLIGVREDEFHPSIYNATNLRTLQVLQMKIRSVPAALFHHLTSIRALDLSHTAIEKLPSEIGKLLHLRYLDLSYLDLGELPEAVSNLYNLQTLNLNWCQRLHKLPKGMGKLTNLRHLNMEWTDWLSILPRGIGRLSSLRTLSKFVVSSNREGCRIGELNNLNQLRGHLEISGLETVTDADEARKADLMNKNHLRSLDLVFSFGEKEAMEGVIEALQPHPNLEDLQLYDYGGSIFPNWIMMLTKLKVLRLLKCESCDPLPPLGKLPSLEKLLIGHMNSLKHVGPEFLGIEVDGDAGNDMRKIDGTVSLVVFPKLKELTFRFMVKWEEWDATTSTTTTAGTSVSIDTGGTGSGGDGDASASSGTGNGGEGDACISSGIVSGGDAHTRSTTRIMMMPSLHSLSLYDCPNLKALPQCLKMIPLKELIIRRCPVLEQRCQIRTGEDWSKISHIPDIQI